MTWRFPHPERSYIYPFVYLFVCLLTNGMAQSFRFTKPTQIITGQDGLPQSFVCGLVQDIDGFIWVGTRDGLARYDGADFRYYRHDQTDTTTLQSNAVTSLYSDYQHQLWIMQDDGLDQLDPRTGVIRHVGNLPAVRRVHSRFHQHQSTAWIDPRGRFWVASKQGGLFRIEPQTGRVRHLNRQQNGLLSDTVKALVADGRRQLWVFTQKGMSRWDERRHRFINYPLPFTLAQPTEPERVQDELPGLIVSTTGELITADRSSFILFDPKRGRYRRLPVPVPMNYGTAWLQADSSGGFFTDLAGQVFHYSPRQGFQKRWETDLTAYRHPQSFLIDRSGVMWYGTNAAGLRRVDLTAPDFTTYPYHTAFHPDVLQQELGLPIQSLLPSLGRPERMQHFSSYLCRTVHDPQQRIWFAHDRDVGYYDPRSRTGRPLPPLPNDQSAGSAIRGIALSPAGGLWCIQSNGLIWYFDPSARHWTLPFGRTMPYGRLVVVDLLADRDQLWITTLDRGLLRFSLSTRQTRIYDHAQLPGTFLTNRLLGIMQDPQRADLLWVGSYEGLICLNRKTGQSRVFTTRNGLPNNTIYAMEADRQGFLWLSTNQGLCRFHPVTHQTRTFRAYQGLQADEFNRFHSLLLPDGRLAFGGTAGWTIFNPSTIQTDTFQPTVMLTSLKINNQPADYRTGQTPLPAPLNTLTELSLPYDQNFLTFEFASTQYNQPNRRRYRYQLRGVDPGWVDAGTLPLATYTKLPPGWYELRLNAANTSGQWSHHIKTLMVRIRPPFWATWWAYLTYILLALGGVYGYIHYRTRRIQERHRLILERQETEQLKTLDKLKSRFFTNITHEFRTPLTLIITPIDQLLREHTYPPALQQTLTSVHRNATQLLQLINQLLDLSKLAAGGLSVTESQGDLTAYVRDLVESFQATATARQISLTFVGQTLPGDVCFDADKWAKISNNLIHNALKFTPTGGQITVELSATVDETTQAISAVCLSVTDTGIGIPADKLPHVFDRFYQVDDSGTRPYEGSGIGLSLVRELTDLLGGQLAMTSTPGQGSRVQVTLPVRLAPHLPNADTEPASLQPAVLSAADDPEPTPPELNDPRPQVLVVDDHPDLRAYIAQGLQAHYRVSTAADGEAAWQLIQVSMPDLVISDVMMPGLDGYALCQRIKQTPLTAHIAVILLTARVSADSKLEGLSAGANDYLAKPFQMNELQLRVANWLSYQQQLRQFLYQRLNTGDAPIAHQTLEDPLLRQLYQILDTELNNPELSVNSLANELAVSTRTLQRKLAALTGLKTNEVIRNYRLKKAAQLLQEGHSVTETAFLVGIDNLSYFSQRFKELFGLSPTAYIQHSRNSSADLTIPLPPTEGPFTNLRPE